VVYQLVVKERQDPRRRIELSKQCREVVQYLFVVAVEVTAFSIAAVS